MYKSYIMMAVMVGYKTFLNIWRCYKWVTIEIPLWILGSTLYLLECSSCNTSEKDAEPSYILAVVFCHKLLILAQSVIFTLNVAYGVPQTYRPKNIQIKRKRFSRAFSDANFDVKIGPPNRLFSIATNRWR